MIIELIRVNEDKVLFTKYIKIKATSLLKSYDSYRIDLDGDKQVKEIMEAGYIVDRDHFFLTIGEFIDLFHKIYENE